MRKVLFRSVVLVLLLILVSGCGLKFKLKEVPVSNFTYSKTETPTTILTVVDQRKGDDAAFIQGRIGVVGKMAVSDLLQLEDMEDPIRYLSVNLEKELSQRGIPIKCVVSKTEGQEITLFVDQFHIVSFRLTGFSPWESCHVFAGRLLSRGKSYPIKAFFYNGKTPWWSMDEIEEPCFQIPASIVIKDLASKINKAVFGRQAPDSNVQQLTAKIDSDLAKKDYNESFWRVLDLGGTNNMESLQYLKIYATDNNDEFFKSCALDAIGMLSPGTETDFLKQNIANGSYNDKYMAIKALGDTGSPEVFDFIRGLKSNSSYGKEGGFRTVVDLYSR